MTEYKQKLTKQFFLDQIEFCKSVIQQNKGAIALCEQILKHGNYVENNQEVKTNEQV